MRTMPNQDAQVLAALRKAGSELDLPHPLRHYLYVPERSGADAAADCLRREGFKAEVKLGALGDQWLVLATHLMVPTPDGVARVRARFEQLAAEHHAEYDGWEAGITRRPDKGGV
jgi:hypothetical protein